MQVGLCLVWSPICTSTHSNNHQTNLKRWSKIGIGNSNELGRFKLQITTCILYLPPPPLPPLRVDGSKLVGLCLVWSPKRTGTHSNNHQPKLKRWLQIDVGIQMSWAGLVLEIGSWILET